MIIAISGMPGCGSTTTAKLLAKRLKLKFFSAGSYTKKIMKDEMRLYHKETKRSVEFWKTSRGRSKKHHITVEQYQQRLAKKGNVVIEGKMSVHFIKKADCRIWLRAPLRVRAERYMKRDRISINEASKSLRKKQNSERTNWKRIYGFDYFEQEKEAELVIDTSDKKPGEIVNIIINSITAVK